MMLSLTFVLLSSRIVFFCVCQEGIPVEPPEYVLNLDSPIYVCLDDDSQAFVDTSEIEVHRYNESATYLSGTLKLLKNIDRHTVVELLVEKEHSGRHDLITSIEICDICDEIDNPESIYSDYLKSFGFPEECPVESRSYTVDNFVADASHLPINSANAGRYQATINLYHNPSGDCKTEKNFLACLKLDLVIEVM